MSNTRGAAGPAMRPLRRAWLAAALAVGLVAGGLAATAVGAQQPVTIQLTERNGSGMNGTATLTPLGRQTRVVVQLANAPGPHPTHIHDGACANLDPSPKYPLTAVSDGRSETIVNATVQEILGTPTAINVHRSPREASVYTSCGDITAAGGGGAQPSPAPEPAALPPVGEALAIAGVPVGEALAITGAVLVGAGLVIRRRRISAAR
jgi:hypothetical protein